jgi:acyl-CoA reductase-like NAD-dependent aldehyde dehydrogenase
VGQPLRLFTDGRWTDPSGRQCFDVVDSTTEEVYYRVALADSADMDRATGAARRAFDDGPWPRLTHAERGEFMVAFARELRTRVDDLGQLWSRQSGALYARAPLFTERAATEFEYYAGLAETYPFETVAPTTRGGAMGLLVREPVGVVGAIVPWNSPLALITHKIAPALLAGCTIVLKLSPEAPGEGLIAAEIAEKIGLPAGVLNVVTADRDVSEQLVRDPHVDKVSFTGSTTAGRRIASLCGERIARVSLELGGKSAALILDDADIAASARTLALAECEISGQVCSSLTRLIVGRKRHDEFVDALAAEFSAVRVGDPFDPETELGPLATAVQRERVEGFIAKGIEQGATLVAGGGRPAHLQRGYFVEPTLFAGVRNSDVIAQQEIFGPVLSVICVDDENEAVRVANDTIYGLNASVFTSDPERMRQVATRLRSGTVGHNAHRADFGIAFGGYKQSGLGREGGTEAIRLFTEMKTLIFDEVPASVSDQHKC